MSAARLDPTERPAAGMRDRAEHTRVSVARLVSHRYALAGTMTMLVAAAGTVLTR